MKSVTKRIGRLLSACLALAITGLLAGCGGSGAPTEVISTHMQFSWEHTIEYTGFQLAERNGYYTEAGLAVDLRPASFDDAGNITSPIDAVVSGEADFGLSGGNELMLARAAGAPIVSVATIYQRSPNALVSLASANIGHPRDLAGKTVSLTNADPLYLYALLDNLGVDRDGVTVVERTDFTTAPLLAGEVDVIDAYLTNEPVLLTGDGVAFNTLVLADYGVDGYVGTIFVTEATLAERPDLVERFLRATFRGYQAAIDDPDQAARVSVEYNEALLYENEVAGMRISVPLLKPAGSPLGMMREEVWQIGFEVLRDAGLIDADFDFISAYTLSVLNRIHGES